MELAKVDEPVKPTPQIKEINLMVPLGDGRVVPVLQAPELATLFPKRGYKELQELKLAILENGQDGKCLYCLWDNGVMVIDGHDTSRAIGELRNEGRPIDVAWELYKPKETEKEKILLELMAIVIRRKNLQTTVKIDDQTKKDAILKYLKNCYAISLYPTSNWVASDLGCSETWVTKVRETAIAKAELPTVPEYRTRNGKSWPTSTTRDDPFKGMNVIPITSASAVKTEDELMEEQEQAKDAQQIRDEKAKNWAEAEADRLIKEAEDKANKPEVPEAPADPTSQAEAHGQDEPDHGPEPDVNQDLEAIYEWSQLQQVDLPEEDLEWFYYGGFLQVKNIDDEPADVDVVDRDQFVTLLASKFAPIVKMLGADPMVFEDAIKNVLNPPEVKTSTRKKPQKS